MRNYQVLILFGCMIIFLTQSNFAFGEWKFLNSFGTMGDGTTNFNSPTGIALDQEGKIYVADFGNNRIQIFDFSGNFYPFIPVNGHAHGIEIAKDLIYVAVWGNPKIDIFTTDGTKVSSFSTHEKPGDIAINNHGEIYVTSYGTGTIQIFDFNGNVLKTISPMLNGIHAKHTGIALDDLDNIYVTDYINDRVMKLDSSGNFLFEFIIPPKEGKFVRPTNIEISSDRDVYVTDNSNKVFIFDTSGNFIYSFGEIGTKIGQFSAPHGITFDDLRHAYIADFGNNRIQIFEIINSLKEKTNNEVLEVNLKNEFKFDDYIYFIIIIIIIIIVIVGIAGFILKILSSK